MQARVVRLQRDAFDKGGLGEVVLAVAIVEEAEVEEYVALVRIERDRVLVLLDRAGEIAEMVVVDAEVLVSQRETGIERDRVLDLLDRRLVLTFVDHFDA